MLTNDSLMSKLRFKRIASQFTQISTKAKSDFVYTGAAQGMGLAASFFTALVITNRLGIDQLGAYALIISIATFMGALADVGIGQTATRYASVSHANSEPAKCNEVLAWSINVRILLAILSAAVGLYISELLGSYVWTGGASSEFISYSFILGALTIVQQASNSYFHTHHNFRLLSLLTFLNSGLILAGILILDWFGLLSLKLIFYTNMLASLVVFSVVSIKTPWKAIYNINSRKLLPSFNLVFKVSEKSQGPMDSTYGIKPQSFAIYLLASSLIVTIFTRLDIWMIGAMLSETDVGIYKLASYFAIPLALAVGALNTTLWPRASKLTTQAAINAFIRKTIRISSLLAIPSSIYILSMYWLPQLIFPIHSASITALAMALSSRYILAILITPAAVVGYSLGMSRTYVLVNTLQLGCIFTINNAFIDSVGLYAPAIALILSELIAIFIIWPALKKRVRTLITV